MLRFSREDRGFWVELSSCSTTNGISPAHYPGWRLPGLRRIGGIAGCGVLCMCCALLRLRSPTLRIQCCPLPESQNRVLDCDGDEQRLSRYNAAAASTSVTALHASRGKRFGQQEHNKQSRGLALHDVCPGKATKKLDTAGCRIARAPKAQLRRWTHASPGILRRIASKGDVHTPRGVWPGPLCELPTSLGIWPTEGMHFPRNCRT